MGWGHRHIQALMMFSCLVTALSIRSSIGVTLIAMTPAHDSRPQHPTVLLNNSIGIIKGYDGIYNISNGYVTTAFNSTAQLKMKTKNLTEACNGSTSSIPLFTWDKRTEETIQSSFFWGYMLLQLPAGALAHRFGAKFLLVTAMLANGIISLCIPYAAIHGGSTGMMICRTMQGLTQAFVVPSLHTLLGKWAPSEERGRLSAFVHGGQALGTVLGLPIAGFLAASSRGWPTVFQFYGALAVVVGGIWAIFGADSPAHHRTISTKERLYIQASLGQKHFGAQSHLRVPWRSILTHKGLWAIVITHVSTSWGQITLYSQIPSYMSSVMKVDIKANGLLTALPFLTMWFANFFFSYVADAITNRKLLGVTANRKLFNTIGCWPPALGLVALGFIPADNIVLMEFILVMICTLKIAAHLGFQINHIDISPNFAGTMMSISNFIANGIASFSPMLAAYFLTDITDQHLWRYVFFTSASIYFFTNLVYIIIGTAEQAEWNELPISETEMVFVKENDTKENYEKKGALV